jgi:hypothetical protein
VAGLRQNLAVEPTDLADTLDENCDSRERVKDNLNFCPIPLGKYGEAESNEIGDWDIEILEFREE